MKFEIEYRYTSYENITPLETGIISRPKKIHWIYEGKSYSIESKLETKTILGNNGGTVSVIANGIYDYIREAYLSTNFIILLYSDSIKYNKIYPHPNNIVIYNLKKEIIKIITKPELINKFPNGEQGTMYSIKEPIEFESSIYIPVYIGYSIRDFKNYIETRYLNVETWVFHPTKNEYMEIPNVR